MRRQSWGTWMGRVDLRVVYPPSHPPAAPLSTASTRRTPLTLNILMLTPTMAMSTLFPTHTPPTWEITLLGTRHVMEGTGAHSSLTRQQQRPRWLWMGARWTRAAAGPGVNRATGSANVNGTPESALDHPGHSSRLDGAGVKWTPVSRGLRGLLPVAWLRLGGEVRAPRGVWPSVKLRGGSFEM